MANPLDQLHLCRNKIPTALPQPHPWAIHSNTPPQSNPHTHTHTLALPGVISQYTINGCSQVSATVHRCQCPAVGDKVLHEARHLLGTEQRGWAADGAIVGGQPLCCDACRGGGGRDKGNMLQGSGFRKAAQSSCNFCTPQLTSNAALCE